MNFSAQYDEYRSAFEDALIGAVNAAEAGSGPHALWESMRYSLLAGGKRIRPVLFLAALDSMGLAWRAEMPLAIAIESIHTYSLIHDDLPAMDNDDFRRGKPSNHKVFGEANAILAGDGLLSWAFEILLAEAAKGANYLAAAQILAKAAGVDGMLAGQSADLLWADGNADENALAYLYANKTGRMLAAPFSMAAALAGADTAAWTAFGEALGYLFQLTDDLLDANNGKDADRLTAVRIYGFARARELVAVGEESCLKLLAAVGPADPAFFEGIVRLVGARKN